MGPDPRIRLRRCHGRIRLERLRRQFPRGSWRSHRPQMDRNAGNAVGLLQQPLGLDRVGAADAEGCRCRFVNASSRNRPVQRSRVSRDRRCHLHLDRRNQGIGEFQFGRRNPQSRDRSGLHRRRRNVRLSSPGPCRCELASVHSAEYGQVRRLWLIGSSARRCSHFLRVHRIRRSLHRRAGSEKSAEGHADRHHRLARHLHGSLHSGFRPPHRGRALHCA